MENKLPPLFFSAPFKAVVEDCEEDGDQLWAVYDAEGEQLCTTWFGQDAAVAIAHALNEVYGAALERLHSSDSDHYYHLAAQEIFLGLEDWPCQCNERCRKPKAAQVT